MHSHCVRLGYKPLTICLMLQEGGVRSNRMEMHKQKYKEVRSVKSRPNLGRLNEGNCLVERLIRHAKEQQQWGPQSIAAAALRRAQTSSVPATPLYTRIVVKYPAGTQLSVTFCSPPNHPGLLDHSFSAVLNRFIQ